MKSIIKLSFLALFSVMLLFTFSCGSDDEGGVTIFQLTIVERTTGTVSIVNTETGSLSNFTVFSANSQDLTNIRSMVYNEITEKLYAGLNNNGGGLLYEICSLPRFRTILKSTISVYFHCN